MVCHLLPFARVGQIYQNIPLLFHYEITQYVMFWDDVIFHSTYKVICKLEYTGTLNPSNKHFYKKIISFAFIFPDETIKYDITSSC